MPDDSSRLAVLIDADNTPLRLVKEMIEELAAYGTITVRRAYGDWASQNLVNWREVLLGTAIAPRQQFAYTSGKNVTDSGADHRRDGPAVRATTSTASAIVSSDSDFTPLAPGCASLGSA